MCVYNFRESTYCLKGFYWVPPHFYCMYNLLSSRDYKEPNKTAAQSNSKHPKSEEFQSQHKPRSNPTSQTTNTSSKEYKDSSSASRSNHDTHSKEATENGEDGLSERDPKRRKTDPNDKEKEITRIRERRDDSEKGNTYLLLYPYSD